MSAPQLTDPGASGEWFRTVAESRVDAAARRRRFTRLVTYMMAGLTAFTLLGLGCFAWRRHSLQAVLDAPVAALPAPQPAAPTQPAAVDALRGSEPSNVTAPSVPPAPAVAPPPPVSAHKRVTKLGAKPSKKLPKRSPLPKSSKPHS